jgi:regulation of enolase protein 1 (concanavalin A-like superfamily)
MNQKLKPLLALLFFTVCFTNSYAQQTNVFKWLNKPKQWKADKNQLTLTVEPATDYWRITHYGFIRDSGPFYYREVAGDFEATVKITGHYKELFHQAGLMIRTDNKNWIKTGIEYVEGVQNVSAVVTHNTSDWSVVPRHDSPKSIWLSLLRKGDFVQIKYSFDGVKYDMLRLAYFQPKVKVQIGMVAAAPGKLKFDALFENFTVKAVK